MQGSGLTNAISREKGLDSPSVAASDCETLEQSSIVDMETSPSSYVWTISRDFVGDLPEFTEWLCLFLEL